MSLVGPRPFMPQQRELHANNYHRYIRIRPGLTGMWQVYGRSELHYDFRIQMDEFYFRNWSIWLADKISFGRRFCLIFGGESVRM